MIGVWHSVLGGKSLRGIPTPAWLPAKPISNTCSNPSLRCCGDSFSRGTSSFSTSTKRTETDNHGWSQSGGSLRRPLAGGPEGPAWLARRRSHRTSCSSSIRKGRLLRTRGTCLTRHHPPPSPHRMFRAILPPWRGMGTCVVGKLAPTDRLGRTWNSRVRSRRSQTCFWTSTLGGAR